MSAEYFSGIVLERQLCDGKKKWDVLQKTGLLKLGDLSWSLSLFHPCIEMAPS